MDYEHTPLTLTEARGRAQLLHVSSYDVDIDLTLGAETYGSRTVVTFECTTPGAVSFIELRVAEFRSAILNGRPLDVDPAKTRVELPDLQATNVLEVDALVPYVRTGDGLHRFVDPHDDHVYVGAYLGMDYCQRIFACFDQPDLKAPITLTVTAPQDWIVRANGLPTTNGDGRWSFATTPAISTYGFALVAGPWHLLERDHKGMRFGVLTRASLAPFVDAQADDLFKTTIACFDFYKELFTEPYPFDSYDSAFVPQLNWGAMESPGCVTFRDEYIFRSPVTDEERWHVDMVIAHEMAHMWFGNLATLKWWDDTWLNESFAEFVAFYALAEIGGYGDPWATNTATSGWGTDADQRPSTHPVAPKPEDVVNTERALDNFDGISYAKGGAVLRQLMTWLGPDVFFAGINDYLTRYRFSNATLADFLACLGESSGRDVDSWAARWLQTTGIDLVQATDTANGVAIRGRGTRPHVMNVSVYDAAPDALVLRERVVAAVDAQSDEPPAVVAQGNAPALVLLNDDNSAYARIQLTPTSMQTVSARLSEVPDDNQRAVLWMMLRDRVREGELPPIEYLELMQRHLPHESNISIVDNVLRFASEKLVPHFLAGHAHEIGVERLRTTSEQLVHQHGNDPAGIGISAARTLIGATRNASHIDRLRGWLNSGTLSDEIALNADLRWRVIVQLAITGGITADEINAAASVDTTGLAESERPRALAALSDPDSKARAWQIIVGEPDQSTHDVTNTVEGFWQPEHADVLEQYRVRYFDEASTATLRRGPSMARALGYRGFPWHIVSTDTVARAKTAIEADATAPDLRRPWVDMVADMERALRVLDAR